MKRYIIEFHYDGGMLLGTVGAESILEAMNKAKRAIGKWQWLPLKDQNDNPAMLRSSLVKFIMHGGTVDNG